MHIHLFSCHVILQLLLENKVNTKGVIRPLEPEIYIPGVCNVVTEIIHASPCTNIMTWNSANSCICVFEALEMLESSGIKLAEGLEI